MASQRFQQHDPRPFGASAAASSSGAAMKDHWRQPAHGMAAGVAVQPSPTAAVPGHAPPIQGDAWAQQGRGQRPTSNPPQPAAQQGPPAAARVDYVERVRAICGILHIGSAEAIAMQRPQALQAAVLALQNGTALSGMGGARLVLLGLFLLGTLLGAAAARPDGQGDAAASDLTKKKHHHSKKRHPYTSPSGLFIQERASKQLPGPGQHFSFGALRPWPEILQLLEGRPNRKLLLVVRHGQAVSNYLSDTLGPDEWFSVEGTCTYHARDGTDWGVFDADLTQLGMEQAKSLHSLLKEAGWAAKLTGSKPTRAIISPLTRCLHTAGLVLKGLHLNATNVEELVRETLGEDTCDARRSVSDPDGSGPDEGQGPCPFEKGLRSLYPEHEFRVIEDRSATHTAANKHSGKHDKPRPLGLVSDEDTLWTPKDRERQAHQVKRAKAFLDILFEHAPEPVVFIITHSGFTRSLLLAARREPYRPVNAELVPVLVDQTQGLDVDDSWELDYEGVDLGGEAEAAGVQ